MSEQLEMLRASAAFSGGNADFIEDLYESFLLDPSSIPEDWRQHFESLPIVTLDPSVKRADQIDVSHRDIRDHFVKLGKESLAQQPANNQVAATRAIIKQGSVLRLINAYRVRGHQNADIDPIKLRKVEVIPDLSLSYHDLDHADLDTIFNTGSLFTADFMPLRDIIELLKEVYTGSVGSEYMHITDTDEKRWVQQRLETYKCHPELANEDKIWLLHMLTAAEGIEKYLHTRYVGQKRFSLEGSESLIPLLDELIQRAGRNGVKEVVIGMAHRGRLNVLANILGKAPAEIFEEFEGRKTAEGSLMTSGDVKYHMGFSSNVDTPGGVTHITLGFNPSHLEIIGPVTEGAVRARQHHRQDIKGNQVLPIVIHGDAAFAGQGVVMETMNMSQVRGFSTGGTVHIVINNQIGFTTSHPMDTRSTNYCTDIGKMVQAPIFHVNGDDPEAVIFVTRLAFDYRKTFHRDVIIDLVSYRRHGHNEADEPSVTQPLMYRKIRQHDTTRTLYAERLIVEDIITPEQSQKEVETYRSEVEQGHIVSRPVFCDLVNPYAVNWHPLQSDTWDQPTNTAISAEKFRMLADRLLTLPEGFVTHPRVTKILEGRHKMALGDQLIDWGFAENMAYASLVDEGFPIRLSGQDCRRGTFFHRHTIFRDQENGKSYVPLQNISENQAHFLAIDSILSEEAVLAFEYGYATTEPNGLTIWEAQFGDFANGAQVVIDQFITSAGAKWGLYCGLVMLLPHGYEGQGPEHSSARLERYIQLCAEFNIQVCIPTTPAQIFHLLRRQILRPFRRPLIIMSPKSLLRHPLATSPLDSLLHGEFLPVLHEVDPLDPFEVKQVIMCSGKIYYDLLEARRARGIKDIALVRFEQIYPFPKGDCGPVMSEYPNADTYVWCQEEPQNQGSWDQIKHRFYPLHEAGKSLYFVGRKPAAAPATGFAKQHKLEQEKIIDDALSGRFDPSMNRRLVIL